MTYAAATAEIETKVTAISGLESVADPRIESLITASKGAADGAFLLKQITAGAEYAELSVNPLHWLAVMELQVLTVVTTNALTQSATHESRMRQITDTLCYPSNALSSSTIRKITRPDNERIGRNRRLVGRMRFEMVYTE